MKKKIYLCFFWAVLVCKIQAQPAIINIDAAQTYQTIAGFSASDCWTGNYVGKYWDEAPRNLIAKYLFSRNYKTDGSPEGIGLSMWRVNLGAGTLEQGNESNIEDISRRAECFLDEIGNYNWTKQAGQQWFMQKAKEYGCEKFVLFSNSPLVIYTRNGKGYSNNDGNANLQTDKYANFADYLATVAEHFVQDGYPIEYISPVNEPQWDWKEPSQEGSPWQNSEIKKLVVELDKVLQTKQINTQILISEAGEWKSLYQSGGRADNQIYAFFDRRSPNYIGDLPTLAPVIGGHSYWSHTTNVQLRNTRLDVKTNAKKYNLSVFQTEWSMLSAGEGFPENYDDASSMDIALFMAKIIHSDLAFANAASWSYWTSMDVERWGHKNRFLLLSLLPGGNAYNPVNLSGTVSDRPTLWALGNYSFFIRPDYYRIQLDGADNLNGLMGSAYMSPDKSKLVAVYVNMAYEDKKIRTSFQNLDKMFPAKNKIYITNSMYSLKKYGSASSETYEPDKEITIPARSVTTIVYELSSSTGIQMPIEEKAYVYPNPVPESQVLHVNSPFISDKLALTIYSIAGVQIYSEQKKAFGKQVKLTLPDYLKKGSYLLKIQSANNIHYCKFLITNK